MPPSKVIYQHHLKVGVKVPNIGAKAKPFGPFFFPKLQRHSARGSFALGTSFGLSNALKFNEVVKNLASPSGLISVFGDQDQAENSLILSVNFHVIAHVSNWETAIFISRKLKA